MDELKNKKSLENKFKDHLKKAKEKQGGPDCKSCGLCPMENIPEKKQEEYLQKPIKKYEGNYFINKIKNYFNKEK